MEKIDYLCRPYKHYDLNALQVLMAQLGYSVKLNALSKNIEAIYRNGGEILIAQVNNETVGSVCVLMDARLAEGIYAEIVSLVVAIVDRHQRSGYNCTGLRNLVEVWGTGRPI